MRLSPYLNFNPRSPRGGATLGRMSPACGCGLFQSTLPTRGSDRAPARGAAALGDFNPRSPRGGATSAALACFTLSVLFQSTLPTRGSDDAGRWAAYGHRRDFNPRSPRGGATEAIKVIKEYLQYFNPRSPRGGATPWPSYSKLVEWIFQSTLPTRGSDLLPIAAIGIDLHFNPRSPRGGAT